MPRQVGENFPSAGRHTSTCPASAAVPAAYKDKLLRVPWQSLDRGQSRARRDSDETPARYRLGCSACARASPSSLWSSSPSRTCPCGRECWTAFRNRSGQKSLFDSQDIEIDGRFGLLDVTRRKSPSA